MATEYKLSYTANEIDTKLGEISGLVEAKERLTSEIAVERARVNALTTLSDGSTTGDAELQDIRIGYNGTEYDGAGEAVRGQFRQLIEEVAEVKSNISVLTTNEKALLMRLLESAVYVSDQSANVEAIRTVFAIEDAETYTIVQSLDNVTSDNNAIFVVEGDAYTATLTAIDGYVMDSVIITMGGEDVTASVYADGEISIPVVTGAIIITAVAIEYVAPPGELISDYTTFAVGVGRYEPNTWADEVYFLDSHEARLSAWIGDIKFNVGDTISIGDYERFNFAIGTNYEKSSSDGQFWIGGGKKYEDYTLTESDLADMKVIMISRIGDTPFTEDEIAYINANAKVVRA
jgi:hypothetical protein